MVTFPWRTSLLASVLGPSEASYTAFLQQHGYSPAIVDAYLHAVGHFAHWLTHESLGLRDLDESVVRRFVVSHLPVCHCPGRCQRTAVLVHAALRRLLDALRAEGRIPGRQDGLPPAIHDELERFTTYLKNVCGLAVSTRVDRRWWMAQFLTDQFDWGAHRRQSIDPTGHCGLSQGTRGGLHTVSTTRVRGCALRSYLRFRATHSADRVDALIAAIPTVASWRLAPLPSHLTPDEVARFFHAFDRRTALGRRGYAMARCMLDLGLRVSEVAALQLDDVNWREGTLRIGAGKARRSDVLPLPVLTGRALAAYLRHDRARCASRAIVRDRAPLDAPITTEIVRHAMETAFGRCGLGRRFTGTHVLRRTAATQMRLAGASLKQIADLLRHRSLDTTTIYTKIDRPQLATLAAPWPGGVA